MGRLALALGLVAGLAACRGCGKKDAPAAATPVEQESRHSQLLRRIADLKIDRTQVYPKNAQGVVTCKDDIRCFVLQAETCTKAEVTYKLTISGYGLHDVVEATYAIEGSEAERCRVKRRVHAAHSHLDQNLVEALRGSGKSEEEIEKTVAEASTRLRRQTPLQLDCWFSSDDVLEVALDLAEQRYNDKLFRLGCHESDEDAPPGAEGAAAPADGGGQALAAPAAPAAPAPAAAPAAPTKVKAEK